MHASSQTFKLFVRAWSLPLIADSAYHPSGHDAHAIVFVLALLALCFPSVASLVVLAVGYTAVVAREPFTSWPVHQYIASSVHCAVLLSGLIVLMHRRLPVAADLVVLLRWPLRAIAAAVFFAGLVKINSDFLDPRISCGGVYYLWIREWPGLGLLPTSDGAKRVAIGATLVIELLGPVLLWWRRTRLVGLTLIWTLAIGLSSNTRAVYFEFIGLFWACSLLWLDPAVLQGTAERLAGLGARALAPLRARTRHAVWIIALLKAVVAAAFAAFVQIERDRHLTSLLIYVWLIGGLVTLASVTMAVIVSLRSPAIDLDPQLARRSSEVVGRAWVVVLLAPAFVLFNEATVYVGLPHRPALKMASNSNMGPAGTNHLLLPHIPALPEFADVRILRSNLRGLRAGDHVPWLLLRHALVGHPEARIRYEVAGGPVQQMASASDVLAVASRSRLVELFGLAPYRPNTKRILCEKAEPGRSLNETMRAMGKRLRSK